MERGRDAHPDFQVKEILRSLVISHFGLKPHGHISLRLLRPFSNHLVTGLKLKLIKRGKEIHKLLNFLMDGMDTMQNKCLCALSAGLRRWGTWPGHLEYGQ